LRSFGGGWIILEGGSMMSRLLKFEMNMEIRRPGRAYWRKRWRK